MVEGPRGGETKIVLNDGSALTKDFLNLAFVKKALGDKAETIINTNSTLIREKQKELESMRKQNTEAEKKLDEQNELVLTLNDRLNKEKAKISQMKDLPEYDEEIKRKKQLAKNLEKDLKNATKERKELEKKAKNIADQDKKYARL